MTLASIIDTSNSVLAVMTKEREVAVFKLVRLVAVLTLTTVVQKLNTRRLVAVLTLATVPLGFTRVSPGHPSFHLKQQCGHLKFKNCAYMIELNDNKRRPLFLPLLPLLSLLPIFSLLQLQSLQ